MRPFFFRLKAYRGVCLRCVCRTLSLYVCLSLLGQGQQVLDMGVGCVCVCE